MYENYRLFRVFAFDSDGVQNRSHVAALAQANLLFEQHRLSVRLAYPDLIDWNTLSQVATQHLGSQIASQINQCCWYTPEVLRKAPPEPGVLKAMAFLNRLPQAQVHTITTRLPHLRECTQDWYAQHAPWMNDGRLHLRENTQCTGDEFKLATARELKVSWFVEDNADTFDLLSKNGIPATLISRPWNSLRRDLDQYRSEPGFWPIVIRGLSAYIKPKTY
ncbi:MAG: hypothetical protein WCT01_05045 [Candidatus Shapirobacteria bacterium]|jgi:hypothetical protein